jgi:hypothetical protein
MGMFVIFLDLGSHYKITVPATKGGYSDGTLRMERISLAATLHITMSGSKQYCIIKTLIRFGVKNACAWP